MKKNNSILIFGISLIITVFVFLPSTNSTVMAITVQQTTTATPCASGGNVICNPLTTSSITDFLTNLVGDAIPIAALIAVIAFIITGFQFIMARGNSEKLSEAKKRFMWVAVGTAILLSAEVVVVVIKNTLVSSGLVNQNVFNP